MKTTSLETMMDRHIGKIGTEERDAFEHELKMDILGEAIKKARKKRKLTQSQLGDLVGVKKVCMTKCTEMIKLASPT